MTNNNKISFTKSFVCAFNGILQTAKERNFKFEFVFMVFTILLGLLLSISVIEWIVVILCFGLVLGGEVLNTALEAVVDLASPEYHELARVAKDAAAGAVLIFSIASFVIGVLVFVPKLLSFIG